MNPTVNATMRFRHALKVETRMSARVFLDCGVHVHVGCCDLGTLRMQNVHEIGVLGVEHRRDLESRSGFAQKSVSCGATYPKSVDKEEKQVKRKRHVAVIPEVREQTGGNHGSRDENEAAEE